ncbi:hypothetical protein Cpir12675_002257 [Ceratocystis pirilliformis]|uniref:Uncharacterized protein n=1 Tax=Ceratocystis pirilliformis TaxID=259994 RepID=A0ABR3ZBT8_9PEZI
MSESPPHKAMRRSRTHQSPQDSLQRDGYSNSSNRNNNDDDEDQQMDNIAATMDLAETISLTESIRGHVEEAGLRYHAYHAGKYPFPNDVVEQDRDDLIHHVLETICGSVYFAPVENMLRNDGGRALDIGTGTGAWCLAMADLFPQATFVGSDLSPIQPETVPPNVQFVIDDFEHEEGWADDPETYDYIHARRVLITVYDVATLMKHAFDHLKPGGWIELQEFTNTIECDDSSYTEETTYRVRDFMQLLGQGLAAIGTDIHASNNIEQHLTAAGFTNITRHQFKVPVGRWPKDDVKSSCGEMHRESMHEGLVGLARKPLRALNWTNLQTEMLLVEVRQHLNDSSFHVYMVFNIICAQKPYA